jgi:hypothetical protein
MKNTIIKDKPLDIEFINMVADIKLHNSQVGEFLKWLDEAGFIKRPGIHGYSVEHSIIGNIKIWFGIDKGMATDCGWYISGTNGHFSNNPNPISLDKLKKYLRSVIKINLDRLSDQYSK